MALEPPEPSEPDPRKGNKEMTAMSVVRRLRKLSRIAADEEGQALVEYALLVSLVALACFVAVQAFGLGVSELYSKIVAVYPS
jgi:Flp pilus assembly pilin Flp